MTILGIECPLLLVEASCSLSVARAAACVQDVLTTLNIVIACPRLLAVAIPLGM